MAKLKITKVSHSFSIKLSQNWNSIGFDTSMEAEVLPGQSSEQVSKALLAKIKAKLKQELPGIQKCLSNL